MFSTDGAAEGNVVIGHLYVLSIETAVSMNKKIVVFMSKKVKTCTEICIKKHQFLLTKLRTSCTLRESRRIYEILYDPYHSHIDLFVPSSVVWPAVGGEWTNRFLPTSHLWKPAKSQRQWDGEVAQG